MAEAGLSSLRSWAKGVGYKCLASPAVVSEAGAGTSGGVAVLARKQYGMGLPAGGDAVVLDGRCTAVSISAVVAGGVDVYSVYGLTGAGLTGLNAQLLVALVCALGSAAGPSSSVAIGTCQSKISAGRRAAGSRQCAQSWSSRALGRAGLATPTARLTTV